MYLVVWILILLGISCNFHSSFTLKGYVYESYSKTPLPGVTIVADSLSVTSDKDGFFRLSNLPDKKVPILVGKNDHYTDLTDILLLDQKINHRDFILDAKHPLGIDLSTYNEPSSYSFIYQSFDEKKAPLSIYSGKSVPIDESLELIGKFSEKNGHWNKIEVVQIGLSFFEKDEYNNWNESNQPNIQALLYQSESSDLIKKAYHFFEDPLLSYKEDPTIITIEGVKTTLFLVKEINPKENPQQYEIYIVNEGANKGQAKKIIRTNNAGNNSSHQTQVSLVLKEWNGDFQILAPQITQ